MLKNISFSLGYGVVALTGKNGTGKTSLLEAIAGITALESGSIEILGEDLVTSAFSARRQLAFVPDESIAYEFLTGMEFLLMVCALRNVQITSSDRLLHERLGLGPYLNILVGSMSLGTQKKLMLASGLLGDAALILLDEPTNGIDTAAKLALVEAVVLRSSRSLIFFSTHDEEFIEMTSAKTLNIQILHSA